MTEIPTLYERLKPGVVSRLKESEKNHGDIVRDIIAKFKNTHFVGDLTIDDMKLIHIFSDTSYMDQTSLSILWGDEIFHEYFTDKISL